MPTSDDGQSEEPQTTAAARVSAVYTGTNLFRKLVLSDKLSTEHKAALAEDEARHGDLTSGGEGAKLTSKTTQDVALSRHNHDSVSCIADDDDTLCTASSVRSSLPTCDCYSVN